MARNPSAEEVAYCRSSCSALACFGDGCRGLAALV